MREADSIEGVKLDKKGGFKYMILSDIITRDSRLTPGRHRYFSFVVGSFAVLPPATCNTTPHHLSAPLVHYYYRYNHDAKPAFEAIYPDVDTAFATFQAHAKENGYAFFRVITRPSRVIFACDRPGNYQSKGKDPTVHKSKQRKATGSKKCGRLIEVEIRLDSLLNQ